MQDHEPTIRSRALGKRLRSVMTAADFNGRELAGKLGWAQSTVSRILAGKHFATETDVAALLAVCDVVGEQRRNLLRLATEVHVLGNTVPRWLNTYAEHEADARRISQFQCVVLPDILQTEDYTHAQLVAAGQPETVLKQECVTLVDRGIPPRMEFIVHEGLLHAPVGDWDVMADQLHHLLRLSVRPFLTLRVLPISAGAHAGRTGPFTLLDFHDFRPVVHRADEHYDCYVEQPDEVQDYRDILARLAAVSLDAERSRALITEVITTMHRPGRGVCAG